MAELANCEQCGKVFVKNTTGICPSCRKKVDEKFDRVWHYIRKQENREATVTQVYEATGVEEKLIFRWIEEGRLRVKDFVNLTYPCASCGAPIQRGKLCAACAKQMEKDLAEHDASEERKKEDRDRYRTYYTQ
ncbi:TIGR03826 family flagellar region protein [Camelliibacillus cellulosilyticus]|uniref:TIGR03826 family flagellar region protein n=1 Tax=Camelliibacillus cellulosilyticus TaxID=2174486 RepID=A0ABV9GN18_9BACL